MPLPASSVHVSGNQHKTVVTTSTNPQIKKMQLVSFWDGPVSWVERLCAASMRQQGHALTLYSYNPEALAAQGLDADVCDARDVLPETDTIQRYRSAKRFAMFANYFRLSLLRHGKGAWVDLDCLMLKPLDTKSGYLFGYSSRKKLNNAVLWLPADSPMLADYMASIWAEPLHTPWSSFGRWMKREIEILSGRSLPATMARTNVGPRALTYFARKHGVIKYAEPRDVFYAIPTASADLFFRPDDRVTERLTPRTVLVHLWKGRIRRHGYLSEPPPATSYLGKACQQYDIAT